MLKLTLATILLLAVPVTTSRAAETCFLSGERRDGMNKICYYDCASGGAAITISAVKLCPLSIAR